MPRHRNRFRKQHKYRRRGIHLSAIFLEQFDGFSKPSARPLFDLILPHLARPLRPTIRQFCRVVFAPQFKPFSLIHRLSLPGSQTVTHPPSRIPWVQPTHTPLSTRWPAQNQSTIRKGLSTAGQPFAFARRRRIRTCTSSRFVRDHSSHRPDPDTPSSSDCIPQYP